MNIGILKLAGVMFFIPGFAVALLIGDCVKTRAVMEIRDHPLIALALVTVELLTLWGLVHFRKVAKDQKPMTLGELPSQIMNDESKSRSNDRLVFLMSTVMHVLGILCGFWIAWIRYRP